MKYLGAGSTLTNIAVLLEPNSITESKKEQTKKYLKICRRNVQRKNLLFRFSNTIFFWICKFLISSFRPY